MFQTASISTGSTATCCPQIPQTLPTLKNLNMEIWLGTNAPVVLTEAWQPDFNFFFSTRSGKRGGGTALVSKNTLSSKEVSFNSY